MFKTFLIIALLSISGLLPAQVPYALMPPPRIVFVDANGSPLSGGFLYSYAAGTSTPLATYHLDTLGVITPNQNPVILDATGSSEVRLLPQTYKFVLQDSSHTQIWAVDQVADVGQLLYGQAVLLNPVGGALQTIIGGLDIVSLVSGPIAASTVTASGDIASSGAVTGANIATYISVANEAVTGTTANELVKLTGAPSTAIATGTGDTSGVIGLCVSGCGITGNAIIQQSGLASCVFSGATTAGNYVKNSSTGAKQCADAGSALPGDGSRQVIGRVLSTHGSGGTYQLVLFGPEIIYPLPAYAGAYIHQVLVGGSGGTPAWSDISGQGTVSLTAGAGAGIGAALSCSASTTNYCVDAGGLITLTPAGTPTASSLQGTITFSALHQSAACSLEPANGAAAALGTTAQVFITTGTITAPSFTITSGSAALIAATAYKWYYVCTFTDSNI